MAKIGEVIKRLRTQLQMPQFVLADSCGLTQATISRLEKGKMETVNAKSLALIAEVLGVTPDYLFEKENKLGVKIMVPRQEVEELLKYYQRLTPEMRQSILKVVKYAQKPFDEINIDGWDLKTRTYRKPEKPKKRKKP